MWVRLDDAFAQHPKILRVSVQARWTFIAGLCYCGKYLTDGAIPFTAINALVPDLGGALEYADELVAAGLWERDDAQDRWIVHDYLDYNPTKQQALNHESAMAAGRAKGYKMIRRASGGRFTAGPAVKNAAGPAVEASTAGPAVKNAAGPAVKNAAGPAVEHVLPQGQRRKQPQGQRSLPVPSNVRTDGPPASDDHNRKETNDPHPDRTSALNKFLAAYPPGRGTASDAIAAWKRLSPSDEASQAILHGLRAWKRSSAWREEGGRYIPGPAKFLTERKWEAAPNGSQTYNELPPRLPVACRNGCGEVFADDGLEGRHATPGGPCPKPPKPLTDEQRAELERLREKWRGRTDSAPEEPPKTLPKPVDGPPPPPTEADLAETARRRSEVLARLEEAERADRKGPT